MSYGGGGGMGGFQQPRGYGSAFGGGQPSFGNKMGYQSQFGSDPMANMPGRTPQAGGPQPGSMAANGVMGSAMGIDYNYNTSDPRAQIGSDAWKRGNQGFSGNKMGYGQDYGGAPQNQYAGGSANFDESGRNLSAADQAANNAARARTLQEYSGGAPSNNWGQTSGQFPGSAFVGAPQTGGEFNPMRGRMQAPMPDQGFAMGQPGQFGNAGWQPPGMAPPPQAPSPVPQKVAPPGYYYREDGMMLQGSDPKLAGKQPSAQPGAGYPDRDAAIAGAGITDQRIQASPGTPDGNRIMQEIYAQERNQLMGQAAPFGRYPDGTPKQDPNQNLRANAKMPYYGGGWGT